LHLADDSQVLFELKVKQNAVSREQIKRHLRDAGLNKGETRDVKPPRLILITPDFREPRKLRDLPKKYREATEWVPWHEVLNFLSRIVGRLLNSRDRMLRDALVVFLKEETGLKKYSP
jgi:hypothetical protein